MTLIYLYIYILYIFLQCAAGSSRTGQARQDPSASAAERFLQRSFWVSYSTVHLPRIHNARLQCQLSSGLSIAAMAHLLSTSTKDFLRRVSLVFQAGLRSEGGMQSTLSQPSVVPKDLCLLTVSSLLSISSPRFPL